MNNKPDGLLFQNKASFVAVLHRSTKLLGSQASAYRFGMEEKMEDRNEWNRFLLSGKVEDYLKYVAKAEKGHKEAGTDTYAGFTYDDRPRPEGGADR